MNKDQFEVLDIGDVIRLVGSGDSYVITYITSDGYLLTRNRTATNFAEWELCNDPQ